MNQKNTAVENTDVAIIPPQAPARIDIDPQALIAAAVEKNVPIEVMEKLLDMRERLRKEAAECEYNEAMAAFQSECPVIVKSNSVDYTTKRGSRVNYEYAPLDVIVTQTRELIAKHGFSYRFTTAQDDKSVTAICHIKHKSGHTESTSLTIPVEIDEFMKASHKVASALTYAKRYTFCNGFGILTGESDTDDNHPQPPNNGNGKTKQPEQKASGDDGKKTAIVAKVDALPENIKQGFKLLGYGMKSVVTLCDKYGWDNAKILSAINSILDKDAK